MTWFVRFLPGLLGAVAGFLALIVFGWLDVQSTWMRFVLFLVVYAAITISVDRALTAYGKRA